MKIIINKFKTAILERNGIKEPFFDDEYQQVEYHPEYCIVSVFNSDNLTHLKTKYEWMGEETINI